MTRGALGLTAALRYAGAGWRVVPCDERGRPLVSIDLASRDPDVIRGWWRDRPDASAGFLT